MPKRVLFDDDAREALRRGLERVARAAALTLGPSGRHVIVDLAGGGPAVTGDGATLLHDMDLADPYENAGARLLREAAERTREAVGDGATTAAVLAYAVVREGLRVVAGGANPLRLKRGIDRALAAAVQGLTAQAIPLAGEPALQVVCRRAAGGDETLGDLVARALQEVGPHGVVRVDAAPTEGRRLRFIEGFQFESGYLSPYFVTAPETMEVVLDRPLLGLVDGRVRDLDDLLPALEHAAEARRPLLVVASAVEGDALAALVLNKLRGRLESCAVAVPAGVDSAAFLEDLALLTGGAVLVEQAGESLATAAGRDLGGAARAVVERRRTTLLGGDADAARLAARRRALSEEAAEERPLQQRQRLERLARLSGRVAVLEVGGSTESATGQLRGRAEDAAAAGRSALEEGVVPGGGLAYLRVLPALAALAEREREGDVRAGVEIVGRALEEPLRCIAANAGANPSLVVRESAAGRGTLGWNAETQRFEDLAASGILDAVKTARVALQNAVSIGLLLLTAEALAVEEEKEEDGDTGGHTP